MGYVERRTGQTWRHLEGDGQTDFVLMERLPDAYDMETWMSTAGRRWFFGDTELRSLVLIQDVPAAAPLAADRAGCKAWCGHSRSAYLNGAGRGGWFVPDQGHLLDRQTWCSQSCRDARLPPLAAQPAETLEGKLCKRCRSNPCNCYTDKAKPAPQPAPACAYGCSDTQANTACPTHGKPAPAKPACERGANLHGGPVLLRCTGKGLFRKLCEHCYLAIEPLQKGPCGDVLHESDVPERLERPKLAHSSQWADEAEDVS
jgi:hypothetical protein